jgi:hypothetical protein
VGSFVSGPGFKALDDWERRIARIASPAGQRELVVDLAHEGIILAGESFSGERAPSGGAWAARAIRESKPIGVRTGALKFSYKPLRLSHTGFRIGPQGKARAYGGIFQSGRGPVVAKSGGVLKFFAGGRWHFRKSVGPAPARNIVPPGRNTLPVSWANRFQMRATRWFQRSMQQR